MKYEIFSYLGINNIKINSSREDVRNNLGTNFKEFVKVKGKLPSDFYTEEGIIIYYKENFFCEAIEMFNPCNVTYKEKFLLKMRYNEVLEFLKQFDINIYAEVDGFVSIALGIGGYCPNAKNNDFFESIICFEKGYYKNLYK